MEIPRSLSEQELRNYILSHIELTPRIDLALKQAKKSHEGQIREDGEPYLTEHIYPVTKMILNYFGTQISEDAIICALLHDCFEDDPEIIAESFRTTYGEDCFEIVTSLSKPEVDKKLSETDRRMIQNIQYFKTLAIAPRITKIIKLLDRIDNLYWAMTFGEELVKIYIRETEEFYLPLAKSTDHALYEVVDSLLQKLKQDAKDANYV